MWPGCAVLIAGRWRFRGAFVVILRRSRTVCEQQAGQAFVLPGLLTHGQSGLPGPDEAHRYRLRDRHAAVARAVPSG